MGVVKPFPMPGDRGLPFHVPVRNIRAPMPSAAFKTKWVKFSGDEMAANAGRFNNACRMRGAPILIEPDRTGKRRSEAGEAFHPR